MSVYRRSIFTIFLLVGSCIAGISCAPSPRPTITRLERKGEEIVAAGQLFHIGTPVVLWMDPGGYDAYRVERRFAKRGEHHWRKDEKTLDSPNRYGLRYEKTMADDQFARLRGGGWSLSELQKKIDQFVIHYDACGISKRCFDILHDHRCLSVHFMLDIDGTIYQTLDLKERAWHASQANDRSIGIEIANIGAYRPGPGTPLSSWYRKGADGRTRIVTPQAYGDRPVRTRGFIGRPIRSEPVRGEIHGRELVQYDLTAAQYDALIKLTSALSTVFPKINLEYPRDARGNVHTGLLTESEYESHRGLIGHFHLTTRKIDPGPAFQWEYVVREARKLK